MHRHGRLCSISILCVTGLLISACEQAGPLETEQTAAPATINRASGTGDFELGRRSLAAGDLAVAKQAFSAALRKYPNDPEVVVGMAETHLALREYDLAQQLYSVLSRRTNAFRDRVNKGRGLIALRKGQNREAVTYLTRSVEQNEKLWRAWLGLGQAHARLGEPAAARRAFAAAERAAPVQAAVVNDIGMSYLHDKSPDRAIEFFQRALTLDPGYETARANLRIARAMSGDYDAAVAGARPDQLADVLNNVGYAAILNRDFAVADAMLRRAMAVSPVYHAAAAANLDLLAELDRRDPGARLARQVADGLNAEPALAAVGRTPADAVTPEPMDVVAAAATRQLPGDVAMQVGTPKVEKMGQPETWAREETRHVEQPKPVKAKTAEKRPLDGAAKGAKDPSRPMQDFDVTKKAPANPMQGVAARQDRTTKQIPASNDAPDPRIAEQHPDPAATTRKTVEPDQKKAASASAKGKKVLTARAEASRDFQWTTQGPNARDLPAAAQKTTVAKAAADPARDRTAHNQNATSADAAVPSKAAQTVKAKKQRKTAIKRKSRKSKEKPSDGFKWAATDADPAKTTARKKQKTSKKKATRNVETAREFKWAERNETPRSARALAQPKAAEPEKGSRDFKWAQDGADPASDQHKKRPIEVRSLAMDKKSLTAQKVAQDATRVLARSKPAKQGQRDFKWAN